MCDNSVHVTATGLASVVSQTCYFLQGIAAKLGFRLEILTRPIWKWVKLLEKPYTPDIFLQFRELLGQPFGENTIRKEDPKRKSESSKLSSF